MNRRREITVPDFGRRWQSLPFSNTGVAGLNRLSLLLTSKLSMKELIRNLFRCIAGPGNRLPDWERGLPAFTANTTKSRPQKDAILRGVHLMLGSDSQAARFSRKCRSSPPWRERPYP